MLVTALHQALTVETMTAGKQIESLPQQRVRAIFTALLLRDGAVGSTFHTLQLQHGGFCGVGELAHLVFKQLDVVAAGLQGAADVLLEQLDLSEVRQVRQQILV